MPRDLAPEARRLDPRSVLEQDPLAASLLERPSHAPALEHIRAHDPRARLELASQALHGRGAELPRDEVAPEAKRRNVF
ncbi:MAG: hypothetical protein LC624_00315 [Halobacteriales archaeon]|nr:hypothetical protein [Halobacteriales archaeon]